MSKSIHKMVWLLISCVVIIIDQASKWFVDMTHDANEVTSLTSFLNITYTHNKGIAFSLFNHSHDVMHILVTVAAILITGFLLVWFWRIPANEKLGQCALAFIIGGAIGNVIDRLLLGHVRDFIHFYWHDWHFAIFNIADAAITLGAALMIIDIIRQSKQES